MEKPSFRPIPSQPVAPHLYNKVKTKPITNQQPFSAHLQTALESTNNLVLSKHAKQRLEQRGINISAERWSQIEAKVNEAKKMGVKDSLVLMDEAALIVSAQNNTVITAMDRTEASTQIFTNISGTIVME